MLLLVTLATASAAPLHELQLLALQAGAPGMWRYAVELFVGTQAQAVHVVLELSQREVHLSLRKVRGRGGEGEGG